MERIPFPPYVNCPQCTARNPTADQRCSSCGKPLTLYIGPPDQLPRRLDLASVMMLIALVAVCLAMTREVPVLGVALLAIAVPALLRTFVWIARVKADGLPMIWPEKLGAFAASAGIVWLILVGAGAAFALVLMVVGTFAGATLGGGAPGGPANGQAGMVVSVVLACVGAVAAGYFLVKALWPIKD